MELKLPNKISKGLKIKNIQSEIHVKKMVVGFDYKTKSGKSSREEREVIVPFHYDKLMIKDYVFSKWVEEMKSKDKQVMYKMELTFVRFIEDFDLQVS